MHRGRCPIQSRHLKADAPLDSMTHLHPYLWSRAIALILGNLVEEFLRFLYLMHASTQASKHALPTTRDTCDSVYLFFLPSGVACRRPSRFQIPTSPVYRKIRTVDIRTSRGPRHSWMSGIYRDINCLLNMIDIQNILNMMHIQYIQDILDILDISWIPRISRISRISILGILDVPDI